MNLMSPVQWLTVAVVLMWIALLVPMITFAVVVVSLAAAGTGILAFSGFVYAATNERKS